MPTFRSNSFRSKIVPFLLGLPIAASLAATSAAADPVPVKMVASPSLSPDGSRMAFAWAGDVWIADVDGGNLLRVTTHVDDDTSPRFSPDGNELAFVSSRSGSRQIYLVGLETDDDTVRVGVPTQVTFHSEGYALHGWFPDGNHVIATGNRDHGWKYARRLIRVNVRDRVAEEIVADAIADQPAVAPDGKRILFVREGERWWRKGYTGERSAQVWLLDTETGDFTELLHEGVDCYFPMWDGDREAFFFTKGDYHGAALCRYDLETEEHVEVANFDDDSIVFPAISRDGSTIVFRHLFDLYSLDIGEERPVNQAKPKKIEPEYAGDAVTLDDEMRRYLDDASDVAFTDDGLEILFTAGGDLWAMDTKLKEPVQLSDTPGFESSPVLVDGAAIVVSVREGQTDLWKVQRSDPETYWWQTEQPRWTRLTNDAAIESDLRISPDGKHLYFVRTPGDLMRMTIDGGEIIRLVDGFDRPEYDLSPCGTWLAYASSDNDFNADVWVTPSDGGGEAYNVSKHPDNDGNPRFSPDGKLLAFTGRRVDTETDIYYVYLQADADEETSRERTLEEAIETMKKKRNAKDPKESGKKASGGDEDTGDSDENAADENEEETEDEAEEDADGESVEPIVIDFEGLDDRVRRISIGNSYENNLIWSPDGKQLVFNATIDGKSGMYSVTFPDELEPDKFSDSRIRGAIWTEEADALLGLVSSEPAKMGKDGKVDRYDFRVRQTYSRSAKFGEGFEQAWRIMRDRWYDERLGGRHWNSVRRKYVDAARAAIDSDTFAQIVQLMLGELNGSHNGFYASNDEPRPPRPAFTDVTAHLGARFDPSYQGAGLLVKDVLPDTPADRVDSRLMPGDVVTMIDGTPVDAKMDLTEVLNGPLDRDIDLTVKRDAEVEPVEVTIRPISYRAARGRLYEKWLADNRTVVDEASDGKLGYVHIRSMNLSSFYEFEKQLYRVGYGRDGLIIDVRDNGGGFTTDILLTALTQPKHAITVPRGGGPGYPQDRMVYATWQKPIVVLCNQNSFSNAEIFSHAIRNLGRGKLVGVQTAGGVISTGSARIMDMGTMRMPFRAWFTAPDGEDMERNGAMPHHVLWPAPGEIPAGKDRQLNKAIAVLKKQVKRDAKKNPPPTLKYDTQR